MPTICMTQNWFPEVHGASIQVVHTEFIKVTRTKYWAFKSLSKVSQEQYAAAVIIAPSSKKNKSRKKETKIKSRYEVVTLKKLDT